LRRNRKKTAWGCIGLGPHKSDDNEMDGAERVSIFVDILREQKQQSVICRCWFQLEVSLIHQLDFRYKNKYKKRTIQLRKRKKTKKK